MKLSSFFKHDNDLKKRNFKNHIIFVNTLIWYTEFFFGKAIETFWRNQLASTIQNLNTRRMSTTEIIKSCLDLGKAKLNTYFGEINWEAHAKTWHFGDVNHCEGGRDMGRGSGGGYGGVWLACALFLLACILYLTNDGMHAFFFLLESSSRLVFTISPVTACILIFKTWHMA